MIKGITQVKCAYRFMQRKIGETMTKHEGLLKLAAINMPLAIAAAPLILKTQVPLVFGICWENDLRDDVANMARQRILKDLTKLEEFTELISDVEPALRDSISRAMAEISKLESSSRFNRSEFGKQQEAIIEMIVKDVWNALEPKIQDEQKKARIKAWIDNLKGKLEGIDDIQQRAADILRENVREILDDFNGKCEDNLGQSIPGEIEGDSADNAMHELAETIVEKIMDKDLNFEIALGQVVSEIKKSQILDAEGKEKLIAELLKDSKTNDSSFNLEKLFEDFRKNYLDPGAGTLHLPKEVEMKHLDRTKTSGISDRLTKKEKREDADTN